MRRKVCPVPTQDLDGMLRTRLFYSDVLHSFCEEGQVLEELISSLQFFDKIVKIIGFESRWNLIAIRDSHAVGTLAKWDKAVNWLIEAMEICRFNYETDHLKEAVLGPRLELQLSDPLGQLWTCSKVGIDLHHSRSIKWEGSRTGIPAQKPVLVSGSLFGSVERFAALLLENCAGQLPLWLAPEQVRVLSLGERKAVYARNPAPRN